MRAGGTIAVPPGTFKKSSQAPPPALQQRMCTAQLGMLIARTLQTRSNNVPPMERSDVERIAAFEQRFAEAQATDVVDLPWGFALLQRGFPDSYSHNRIVVTSAASAVEILSATDELLSRAGVRHRYVSVADDALGQDLILQFVDAGFEHEPLVTMIHSGREVEPPTHPVLPMSLHMLRPAIIRDWRVELPDATDGVLSQLAERTALYSRGADVTLLYNRLGYVEARRTHNFTRVPPK